MQRPGSMLAVIGSATALLAAAGTAAAHTTSSGATTPGATTTLPTDETTSAACVANGHLPGVVQGAPMRLNATKYGDLYIWHSANGWHLRVRHATRSHEVFTGQVNTGGVEKISYKPFHLEKNDSVSLNGTGTELNFTFNNYGGVDGIDFTTNCAKLLTFSNLTLQGQPINPDRVHLGRAKLAVLSVPFTVQRRQPAR
jgi:hypothetical protein